MFYKILSVIQIVYLDITIILTIAQVKIYKINIKIVIQLVKLAKQIKIIAHLAILDFNFKEIIVQLFVAMVFILQITNNACLAILFVKLALGL